MFLKLLIYASQESDTTEGAAKEEKMDVDDTPAKTGSKSTDEGGEEDYSEVMNDPEFLQVIIHLSLNTLHICSSDY